MKYKSATRVFRSRVFCPYAAHVRRAMDVRTIKYIHVVTCQRVGRLSMWGWHRRAIYAILKQKPYNFTTNMLKAYLSAQASSLSAFVISKTHIVAQKPHGR